MQRDGSLLMHYLQRLIEEKPMNAHLIKLLLINGFLAILFIKEPNIIPTPTPTPANTINGILDARYLNPSNIIGI